MPIIVLASPKGGVGKTTCAVLLATGFARMGAEVTVFDCDPTHALTIWADRGLPPGVTHGGHPGPEQIIVSVMDADGDGRIVIVDVEGQPSPTVSRAVALADLVIVPMQATALDSAIGSEVLAIVREEEARLGRPIRHAVVLTRTSAAVKSRVQRDLESQLQAAGVDQIQPSLVQRAAFAELFTFGGDLETMAKNPEVRTGGRIDNAITNAREFTESVFERLTSE